MKSYLDCVPCFVRQALDACRMITKDEKKIHELLRKVLVTIANANLDQPPPVIVSAMHRVIRQELDSPDPYLALKKKSTEKALLLAPEAEKTISKAENPFEAAIRFAIAGNILDFGAKTEWSETLVRDSFEKAMKVPIVDNQASELYSRISLAKTVLVLGDNAGEAVFDRLFINRFPGNARVLYAVKGSPVINDVTLADAKDAGLDTVAEIISNGTDIPGTHLPATSDEFRKIFYEADVIISKGQGNYETLLNCDRRVFCILQIKCESLAKRYGFSLGDWVVTITGKE
ncbi:MAG TPA: DUF89 family protein [Treponema sp.]|nr:DUF89 family protein [Treponema sp.]